MCKIPAGQLIHADELVTPVPEEYVPMAVITL
jgi:hypothetical protein